MLRFALAGLAAIAALPAPAAPRRVPPGFSMRCGWLSNPTPQNFFLTDREREWTLSTQGGAVAEGFDDLRYDRHAARWVATNGSYGYGCACGIMRVDRRRGSVVAIRSLVARPLAACRADRRLPRP